MVRALKKTDGDIVITGDTDNLISKMELMERLNVSRATIQRWLRIGLPYTPFANFIVFNYNDVKKWLEQQNYGDIDLIARLKREKNNRRKRRVI
jgi:predicted site-specific integrase-resolvase